MFVGQKPLRILIDSGNTHSFLDEELGKQLGCQLVAVQPVNITVANAGQLTYNFTCQNFHWCTQDQTYTTDILLVPLENYNMILGVQWLMMLGNITCNFDEL